MQVPITLPYNKGEENNHVNSPMDRREYYSCNMKIYCMRNSSYSDKPAYRMQGVAETVLIA